MARGFNYKKDKNKHVRNSWRDDYWSAKTTYMPNPNLSAKNTLWLAKAIVLGTKAFYEKKLSIDGLNFLYSLQKWNKDYGRLSPKQLLSLKKMMYKLGMTFEDKNLILKTDVKYAPIGTGLLTSADYTLIEKLKRDIAEFKIVGPERAGKDVLLGEVFSDYTKPDRPVDFVIYDGSKVLAIGLARYDSDRGGAQEDDRTGQYREVAHEIIKYADSHDMPKLKIIFVNDGPGLLLGSMWNDYSYIEDQWNGRVKVVTLRMVPERITKKWIRN